MSNLSREEYMGMLIPILRQHEIFTDLIDEEVAHFAGAATCDFYKQGTRIIAQGEEGDEFFVILDGQLRAIDMSYDPPHLLNYHDTGQIVGARALLTDEPRAATVEIVVEAQLAAFDRDDWDWLIQRRPGIETYFQSMESKFAQRSQTQFSGRQWDEVVVASTRRHILAFVSRLPLALILLVTPVVFLIIAELLGIRFSISTSKDLLLPILVFAPFVLLATGLVIYHYMDWRNDDFILTTKRFVHIERKLLYGEQRDEAPLIRIQDVRLVSPGFLGRVDYFNLRIKTAGAGEISIKGIPQAQQMKDQIFLEKERVQQRAQVANVATIRQRLAQELAWEEILDETTLAIAEAEEGMTSRRRQGRMSKFLRYFWPLLQDIEPDGVTITWRKHYWVLLQVVGLPLLATLVSFYFCLAAAIALPPFGESQSTFVLVFGILTLAGLAWYLWRYDGWRRDIYQLTRNRIIHVIGSSGGVGGELRSEAHLGDIQNITYEVPNFFSRLLNMGSVVVETAGTEVTFAFHQVLDPKRVQKEIFNRMVLVQQREREDRRDAKTQDLLKVFAEYKTLLEKASAKGHVNFLE